MQPIEQSGTVTSNPPSPLARLSPGMAVVDAAGAGVGRVTAVQPPGTGVRPDAVAGTAEVLMAIGYLRIDGTGFLTNDVYAAADQIADVTDGDPAEVRLRVPRTELPRTTA